MSSGAMKLGGASREMDSSSQFGDSLFYFEPKIGKRADHRNESCPGEVT
jgi:hypothetical protein